ncbi:MAG TPA: thioredoxin [Flavobacteriaceae bacterium]|jgi:thioredoxin-related protein|nr:thioredoxin [Flavobacteriaceae bacterium]
MRLLIALFTLTFCLHAQAQKIEWMSFEAAIDAQAKADQPKKIFIDVYTDWCGWCKKMDKETFNNPEVAVYMQQHFYMVKLDGEGKKPIVFRGKTFSFVPSGRNGYHELAAGLMQGQLSYPTVVFLNEQAELLSPVPGYHPPESFMPIARFFGDNHYKTSTWEDYQKKGAR